MNAHHKVNVQESESESGDEVFSSSANESLQLVWGRRKGKDQKSKERNEDQSGARKLRNIIFSWNAHAIREKVARVSRVLACNHKHSNSLNKGQV